MSFKGSARRSIKSAQLGQREMHITYTGLSGDVVGGVDRFLVSSVTDGGAGLYTINLTGKASMEARADVLGPFLKGFSSTTADCLVQVVAVTGSTMQVQCHVAGVAADADISLTIGMADHRMDYEA